VPYVADLMVRFGFVLTPFRSPQSLHLLHPLWWPPSSFSLAKSDPSWDHDGFGNLLPFQTKVVPDVVDIRFATIAKLTVYLKLARLVAEVLARPVGHPARPRLAARV
jgi:hypothetical protein